MLPEKQLELYRQDTQKHRKMTRGIIEDLSEKVQKLRLEFLTEKVIVLVPVLLL